MQPVTFTTPGALRKSALRQANERLVMNAIRVNPGISRADLVRLTSMRASSVTFIINRLIGDELIEEGENCAPSQVGRVPRPLRLRAGARLGIAIEIARPHCRLALANLEGRVLKSRTVPWQQKPEVLFPKLHTAMVGLMNGHDPSSFIGIGVALPGTLDRENARIVATENFGWADVDLGRLLLGSIDTPLFLENEAKVCALAEVWFAGSSTRSLRDFVYVKPTEGLGVGAVIEGRLLQGSQGAAPEFGHIMLHPEGRRCSCGNRGCWERYASADAFVQAYRDKVPGAPESITPGEVIALCRQDDASALAALNETAVALALGLVNVIVSLNPQAVIFGGYAAEVWDLIEHLVWKTIRERAPRYFLSELRMYPSAHAANAVMNGAIALVLSRFFNSFDHSESLVSIVAG